MVNRPRTWFLVFFCWQFSAWCGDKHGYLFFSGARFCWCFTHWTSPNLQHLLPVFPVGSGAWDPETSPRMVSPSVHQIRVEFREKKPKGPHSGSIFRAPNKTTWLWGAMWEGGCYTPVAPRLCRHAWAGSQNGGLETRIWGAPWNLAVKNRVSTLKKPGQRTRELTEVDFQNVPCAKECMGVRVHVFYCIDI